jgi:hypothetical protein
LPACSRGRAADGVVCLAGSLQHLEATTQPPDPATCNKKVAARITPCVPTLTHATQGPLGTLELLAAWQQERLAAREQQNQFWGSSAYSALTALARLSSAHDAASFRLPQHLVRTNRNATPCVKCCTRDRACRSWARPFTCFSASGMPRVSVLIWHEGPDAAHEGTDNAHEGTDNANKGIDNRHEAPDNPHKGTLQRYASAHVAFCIPPAAASRDAPSSRLAEACMGTYRCHGQLLLSALMP